jgi:hypothetical protein
MSFKLQTASLINCLVAAFALSTSEAASPKVGDHVRITATAACPTMEDIARVSRLVGAHDVTAAEAYIAGNCLDLPGGMEFTIESIGARAFCGRSLNSNDCLWMPQDAIQPDADAH